MLSNSKPGEYRKYAKEMKEEYAGAATRMNMR